VLLGCAFRCVRCCADREVFVQDRLAKAEEALGAVLLRAKDTTLQLQQMLDASNDSVDAKALARCLRSALDILGSIDSCGSTYQGIWDEVRFFRLVVVSELHASVRT